MATTYDETTITLELPFPIKSQNQFQGRHWTVKHQDRLEWAKVVRAITHAIPIQRLKAKGPRKVTIIADTARTDLPNIGGGAKGFIDALVDYGMLVDDSQRYLKGFSCLPSNGNKKMQIILEDVEDVERKTKRRMDRHIKEEA